MNSASIASMIAGSVTCPANARASIALVLGGREGNGRAVCGDRMIRRGDEFSGGTLPRWLADFTGLTAQSHCI